MLMNHNQSFYTVRGYQLLEEGKRQLTPAMEDYLEMIYRSSLNEEYLRVGTLAELLNVRASSVTKMVQSLAHLKLLDYKKYGIIILTNKGKKIGEFLLNRHNIIERFLSKLGVTKNLLIETELIEHNISKETVKRIEYLNRFFESNPKVFKEFENYRDNLKED